MKEDKREELRGALADLALTLFGIAGIMCQPILWGWAATEVCAAFSIPVTMGPLQWSGVWFLVWLVSAIIPFKHRKVTIADAPPWDQAMAVVIETILPLYVLLYAWLYAWILEGGLWLIS